jgi:hypothetical protein
MQTASAIGSAAPFDAVRYIRLAMVKPAGDGEYAGSISSESDLMPDRRRTFRLSQHLPKIFLRDPALRQCISHLLANPFRENRGKDANATHGILFQLLECLGKCLGNRLFHTRS